MMGPAFYAFILDDKNIPCCQLNKKEYHTQKTKTSSLIFIDFMELQIEQLFKNQNNLSRLIY